MNTAPVVAVHASSSDAWSEGSITWNNQPSYSATSLATQRVYYNNNYRPTPDQWWFSWSVTGAIVQSLNTTDDLVTFVVRISSNLGNLAFNSKENPWSHPELLVEWTGLIPEFPSFLILPLFMLATLLVVIAYRRKHSMQH